MCVCVRVRASRYINKCKTKEFQLNMADRRIELEDISLVLFNFFFYTKLPLLLIFATITKSSNQTWQTAAAIVTIPQQINVFFFLRSLVCRTPSPIRRHSLYFVFCKDNANISHSIRQRIFYVQELLLKAHNISYWYLQ